MELDFTNTSQICIFIILATYIIMTVIKHLITSRYRCNNVIPPLAMIVGGIISFVIMKIEPGYLGTNSLFEGLTIGIISGGCATSVNQVAKKLGVCINLSNLIDNSAEPATQNNSTVTTPEPQNYNVSKPMTVVTDQSGNQYYLDEAGVIYPILIKEQEFNKTPNFNIQYCTDSQTEDSTVSTNTYTDPNVVKTVTGSVNTSTAPKVTIRS